MKLIELNNLIDEFLDCMPFKRNSLRAYKTDLFFFSQFYITEKIPFIELNKTKLLNWLSQYPERVSQRRGTNIRRFLIWLSEHKDIKINPEFNLPWQFTENPSKKPDRAIDLTAEQIDKLLYSQNLRLNHRCLMALILEIGASLEELANLKWTDLNLGKLPHITLGEVGKARVIPLENNIINLLLELKQKSLNTELNIFWNERDNTIMQSSYMAIVIRRATSKVLGFIVSPTQIQEYAKNKLLQKFPQIQMVLQVLGKKRAFSLIKTDIDELDMKRLKDIHHKAFSL